MYPVGDDEVRQHYAAAWECELAGTYGRPVVLEEFGVSSDFVSGAHAARYYRQVLHNSLLAGATGWIGWCNSDFDDLAGQDPYRHHAFELHFGLTDSRGQPQAAASRDEGVRARCSRAVDIGHCQRAAADTALVVSSYLDTSYPFTAPADPGYIHQTLRQAYVSARLADLPVALARESDGIGGDAVLYLVPSVKQLLAPTWPELGTAGRSAARRSTCRTPPGRPAWHRGPSYDGLNAMFGVEHQLRAGLVDPIEDDQVTFTFGAGLRLAARRGPADVPRRRQRAQPRLPAGPPGRGRGTSRSTATAGLPCCCASVGAGSLVLCTYPIEHMAAVDAAGQPGGDQRRSTTRSPRTPGCAGW